MSTCTHMMHRLGLRLLRYSKSASSCDRFPALQTSLWQSSSTAACSPTPLQKRRFVDQGSIALLGTSDIKCRQYSTKARVAKTIPPLNEQPRREERPSFDEQLWAFYHDTRPNESMLEARRHAIIKVQETMNDFVRRNRLSGEYRVELSGPVACGFDLPDDELEFVVIDPLMPFGWRPRIMAARVKRNPLYDPRLLREIFKDHDFSDVSVTRLPPNTEVRATTPVSPSIGFELKFNLREKLQATHLIGAYASLDERVAPMVVFMSEWFNRRRLSKTSQYVKGGELVKRRPFRRSTIALLVVAYLQVMKILPNLQSPFAFPAHRVSEDDIADRVKTPITQWLLAQSVHLPSRSLLDFEPSVAEIWWHAVDDARSWRAPADLRFLPSTNHAVQEWCSERKSAMQHQRLVEPTLAELVQGFFQFWSQFPFREWAVSVRDGGIIKRVEGWRDIQLELELEELNLGRYRHKYQLREEIPEDLTSKIDVAAELMLQKVPDLPPSRHVPILVLKPFQSSVYVKMQIAAADATGEERDRFAEACGKADKAIQKGQPLHNLLPRPAASPAAKATKK